MTNETKLHPAVEALPLPPAPWAMSKQHTNYLTDANGGEVAFIDEHTYDNVDESEDTTPRAGDEATAIESLLAVSPEMLSWMVQDLSAYQSIENPPAHIQQGRELVKRASNGRINLDYTPF